MKKLIRTLSLLVCMALLMTSVPVESLLNLRAYASEVVVATTPAPTPESEPETESESQPAQAPEQEAVMAATQAPEATATPVPEEDGAEASAEPSTEPGPEPSAEASVEPSAEPSVEPSQEPTVEPSSEPASTEDPNAIDYAADAGKSPAFVLGYAEITDDETTAYDGADASAGLKLKIGRGVVYVVDRSADSDRLEIAFNAGQEKGVDTAWVDAACARPMDPATELHPYFLSCEEAQGLLFYNNDTQYPLQQIACEYPQAENTVQPEGSPTSEPAVESEPSAEPTPGAEPSAEPAVESEPSAESTPGAEPSAEPAVESEPSAEPTPEANAEGGANMVAAVYAVGLSAEGDGSSDTIVPTGISVVSEQISLGVGNTVDLIKSAYVTLQPEGASANLSFRSLTESVASVDAQGVITAHAPGSTTIRVATDNELSADITVRVWNIAQSLTVSPAELTLLEGESGHLEVAFPDGTYDVYSFSASEDGIVSVDGSGVVTAQKAGKTTVTVAAAGGASASCAVTVLSVPETIGVNVSSLKLERGDTYQAVAGICPEGSMCEFVYSSEDTDVAVVDPETGAVEAVGPGRTRIVVTAANNENARAYCEVVVIVPLQSVRLTADDLKLGVGNRIDLIESGILAFEPADAAGDFSFATSNSNYVTVSADGVIQGVRNGGYADITVSSASNASISDTLRVTVYGTPASVSIEPASLTLGEGMTGQLTISFPAGAYNLYTVGGYDPEVISIDADGTVRALKAGKTTVTVVADNGVSASSEIAVLSMPEEISVSPSSLKMSVGQLGVAVAGVCLEDTLCDFSYESDNPTVVEVDPSTGAVTAVGPGKATITVTAVNNAAAVAYCQVEVAVQPTDIALNPSSIKMGKGDVYDIIAAGAIAVTPADSFPSYTFKSSNTKVATVTSAGVIEAVNTGSAKITVATHNKSRTLSVTVYNPPGSVVMKPETHTMGVDDTLQLGLTFPSKTYSRYSFAPEVPGIVSVTSGGLVQGLGEGTVTVKASTQNGKEDTMSITILPYPEEISAAKEELIMSVGQTGVAAQGVYPEGTKCAFLYSIDDPTVAAINETTGAVNALKVGETTITIAAKSDASVTADVKLKVVQAPTSVSLSRTSMKMGIGDTYSLIEEGLVICSPEGATTGFSFKSSNTKVATVTSAGVIKAVRTGTAKITITPQNRLGAKTLTVSVYKAPSSVAFNPTSLTIGLNATGLMGLKFPSNTYSLYKITVEDPSIVDFASTGVITPYKAGTTPVSVVTRNGLTATGSITVLPYPEEISAAKDELIMSVGQAGVYAQGVYPEGTMCSFTYSIEDETVAAINADTGKLNALKMGETTITIAAKNDPSVTAEVTLKVVQKPTSISLTRASMKMGVGDTYTIPEEGLVINYPEGSSASYTYKSSNTKVATVTSAGVIKAVRTGTAKITIKPSGGTGAKTLTVSVYKAPSSVAFTPANLTLGLDATGLMGLKFPSSSYSLYKITVEDPSIVDFASTGVITPYKEGTTPVNVVTRNGKIATGSITVLPYPEEISAAKDELIMSVGQAGVYAQGVYPEGTMCSFTYSIEDETVAAINADTGKLNALKMGETTITIAAKNDPSVTAEVTLKVVQKPTSISLTRASMKMGVGDTYTIPEEGLVINYPEGSSASYTYKSSNTKVATVSAAGVIKAVHTGTAKITIKPSGGSGAKTLTVSVYKAPSSVAFNPASLTLGLDATGLMGLKFPSSSYSLYKITVEDPSIVDFASTGVITPYKSGTTPVNVVTRNGLSATATITVLPYPEEISAEKEELIMSVGQAGVYAQGVYPEGTMCSFVYSIDDPKIATINETTGAIKALKMGEATITIASKSDESLTAEVSLKVVQAPTSISLSRASMKMGIGDTYTIPEEGLVINYPEGSSASYAYKSSNTKVATVTSAGVIKAVSKGTAKITITPNGNSKLAKTLTVSVYKAPSSVAFNPASLTLGLDATGLMGLTFPSSTYSLYKITVEDPSIVDFASTGVITPYKSGTTPVNVVTRNGLSATATITVLPYPEEISAAKDELIMSVGQAGVVAQGVYPEGTMCSFVYSIDDPKIATINETTGAIKALKMGEATITIASKSDESLTAEVSLKVVQAPTSISLSRASMKMGIGDTYTIPEEGLVINYPEGSSASYAYKSSNTKVATVTSTGVIKAVSKGTAKITITPNGNSKLAKTLTVSVYKAPSSVAFNPASLTLGLDATGLMGLTFPSSTYSLYKITVEDPSIVDFASTGVITPYKSGTTPVNVVTRNGLSATATITVLPYPEEISVARDEITLGVGQTGGVVQGVYPEGTQCEFVYSSLNESVATVNAATGAITAVGIGEATIVVSAKSDASVTAECKVTVLAKPASIILRKTGMNIGKGDTYDLLGTGFVRVPEDTCAGFTFKSSNPKVATVSAAGVITGVKAGSAAITITTHNGVSRKLTVTVYNAPSSVSLQSHVLTLGEGMTGSFSLIFPANTYSQHTLKRYDPEIISVDEFGTVTALKDGFTEAIVTTRNGLEVLAYVNVLPSPDTIDVVDDEIILGVGQTGGVVQGVYPDGTMCSFTYSSDSDSIAIVNETTGAITAVGEGTATITVASTYDPNVTAECTVHVRPKPTGLTLSRTSMKLGTGNTFDLLKSDILQLAPENACTKYSFSSSNKAYVTVSADGVLTGVKAGGYSNITIATHNGIKQTIRVTVYNPPSSVAFNPETLTLGVGMSKGMGVVFPSNTYNVYHFESADEDIATIDEKGVVTATGLGEVKLRVWTDNQKEGFATLKVVPAPTFAEFEQERYEVTAGMKLQAVPMIDDGSMASFTFGSSDPTIADIDENGVITGIRDGEVTITVTTQNGVTNQKTCTVKVTAAPYKLTYNGMATQVIAKGDTITIPEPTALDVNGYECPATYTYTSSNASVAKISGNTVTGVAAGTVTITAKSHNSKTVTFKLTVSSSAITDVSLAMDNVTLFVNDEGYFETAQLHAAVVGAGLNNGSLTYKNSNDAAATVDQQGNITAVAPGSTTITVTAFNGVSSTCEVTVMKLSSTLSFEAETITMTEGKQLQLSPVFDENTGATLSYESSDTSIATVNAQGMVTAYRYGDITITAKGQLGLEASVKLHIIAAPGQISLNVTAIELAVGESITLKPELWADVEEFDRSLSFKTTNSAIASVDANGVVKALSSGPAVITATTCNDLTVSCKINVLPAGQEPKAGFGWDTATIVLGDNAKYELFLNRAAMVNGYKVTSGNPDSLGVFSDMSIEALRAAPEGVELILTVFGEDGVTPAEVYTSTVRIVESTDIAFSASELELKTVSTGDADETSAVLTVSGVPSDLIGTFRLEVMDETVVSYDPETGVVQALNEAGETEIVCETFDQVIYCKVIVTDKPTYRALIIAEFAYSSTAGSKYLPFATNNVTAMRNVFNTANIDGQTYEKVVSYANDPTETTIRNAIQTTFADAKEGDVSVIYIVAHGYDESARGGYYFGTTKLDKSVPSTYITHSELMSWMEPIPGDVVLILDSCKSGSFIRDAKSRLDAAGNIAVLTAQKAGVNASYYQGASASTQIEFMTYSLCRSMGYDIQYASWSAAKGDSDGDGLVTLNEAFTYTRSDTIVQINAKRSTFGKTYGIRVPSITTTSAFNNWSQEPQIYFPNEEMKSIAIFG